MFSAASATGAFNFGINPNGALILSNYGTGPVVTGNAGDVPLNSWCHIVAVRSSTSANDTKLYANGVLKVTGTDANTWTVSSSPIIGGFTTVSNYDFIGYISNFRIVKGTAVYTSNFTPPTEPLTAIANTSLLLKNTNAGIYDTSGNNDIETVGNAQVSTAITKYGSSSMYFDGSGDYLNSPSNQNLVFGTGDFTIEGWFYLTASAASIKYLFDCRSGGGIQAAPLVHIDSGTFKYYVNGSYVASGGTVTQNQWMHIALVKTSGSTKLYVNGNLAFTYTDSINYTSSTVRVGSEWSAAGTYDWAGYISDFRITKGLARYTANFTPPTSELKG